LKHISINNDKISSLLKCKYNYATKEPLIENNDQIDLQIFAIEFNFLKTTNVETKNVIAKGIISFQRK
jgi:hypothetical protein